MAWVLRHLGLPWVLLGVWMLAWAQEPGRTTQPSKDAVIERSWLGDTDSSLSPQAALAGSWKPFSGPLSRGFTASTTWLRLKIDPDEAGPSRIEADHRLVLRILPGHLDEVAVFRPGLLSQPPVLVGDRHEPAGAGQDFVHHALVIDDATEPFEVLLRLRTQSNHSIHVQALRWDDAREAAFSELNLLLAYLVFTALVIAWSGLAWLERRDTVLGLFVAHQGSALLVAVTLSGVLRLYGPEGVVAPAIDRFTSLVIPLHTMLTVLFHARLLADLGSGRAEVRLLQALAGVPALGLLLVALGQVRAGLMLTQTAIPFTMPLLIVIAWRVRLDRATDVEKGRAWRRAYLVAVYVAMAAITMPQSLRVLGLLPARAWTYGGFIAYSVSSSLLLGSLLAVRARQARRRQRQAEVAFYQAQREAEAQRSRAAEQAELMTMLTHELKTPLSVVSLSLGNAGQLPSMRKRALRAVDNMRDVIDRCALASRLDDEIGRHDAAPTLEPMALQEVLVQAVAAHLQANRVSLTVAMGVPPCQADTQMLTVVVTNLLDNALKYSPKTSPVRATITATPFEGRPGVALRVINKVGVTGQPDATRVFEKYYRGTHARQRSGSGLGLYLARRLAYRMAGELSLVAGSDDEVCFELWMPG